MQLYDCRSYSRANARCRTVPCNSPSSDDARDFSNELYCDPDPCDCPSMTEVSRGRSRRSYRRAASAPPARRPQTRCPDPVDFECGFLRQMSDCDCIESETRPPFVVRRVIYMFIFFRMLRDKLCKLKVSKVCLMFNTLSSLTYVLFYGSLFSWEYLFVAKKSYLESCSHFMAFLLPSVLWHS